MQSHLRFHWQIAIHEAHGLGQAIKACCCAFLYSSGRILAVIGMGVDAIKFTANTEVYES